MTNIHSLLDVLERLDAVARVTDDPDLGIAVNETSAWLTGAPRPSIGTDVAIEAAFFRVLDSSDMGEQLNNLAVSLPPERPYVDDAGPVWTSTEIDAAMALCALFGDLERRRSMRLKEREVAL